jgi:cyclohexanone monooxygenase
MADFPNLFMITGPQSPGVKSQMMLSCEQHVNWIADCLTHLRDTGQIRIEPEAQAETEWVQHNNDVANATLYPLANSWYVGANIPGKPRIFMPYVGGVQRYKAECDAIAANGYKGFVTGP